MGHGDRPTLWHIPVSHYNEKVRWALDLKGVEYEGKTPSPHPPVALALTRGRHSTLPIMRIDGRIVHDSTAIIAALEERYPDPPLYPADPEERRRALAIEDWFDEEVAPHVRLLAWHEVTRDKAALGGMAGRYGGPFRRVRPLAARVMSSFVKLRYGVHDEGAAAKARELVPAAFDRIERELGDGDYMVGDTFTVADLTAAALLYPIVTPPEAPDLGVPPRALQQFGDSLRDRRGFGWVAEMFRRHRHGARAGDAGAVTPSATR
jgi:glutathione S-transferase